MTGYHLRMVYVIMLQKKHRILNRAIKKGLTLLLKSSKYTFYVTFNTKNLSLLPIYTLDTHIKPFFIHP